MLGFALFGAGLIGHVHAANLAANPRAYFVSIYDLVPDAARELAAQHGVAVAPDVDAVLSDRAVDAVVIGSPTATHVDLLTAAAKAGKAVFCEKPIDLDLDRVVLCREEIAGLDVPIQIGFNRRFDPSHRAVHDAVRSGEVGQVEMVIVTSRDRRSTTLGDSCAWSDFIASRVPISTTLSPGSSTVRPRGIDVTSP